MRGVKRHGRDGVGARRAAAVALALLVSALTMASAEAADLAQYQFGAGWATFGLALPQGAATGGVRVGALPTQTDVKTTWTDGSIRFAVVTAKIERSGPYTITSGGGPSSGTLAPAWPTASVTFVSGGQTYVATLPSVNAADRWLSSGSLVRESRVIVTPKSSVRGAHPLLQVIFDVRNYAGGGYRVDVTVQNVQDVAAGDRVTYDVTVSIGDVRVYTKSAVVHAYLTRWRQVFLAGGLVEAAVTPDFEPFYQANAVPRFLDSVDDQSPAVSGDKFEILNTGDMWLDMTTPGGRPEIAPYPDWVARYVVHKRPAQRAYMLAHADLSGSWSGHITEPDGQTLISLDRYPDYWLDGRAGKHPYGPAATRVNAGGGVFLSGMTNEIENAHVPSLAFVPYLVTGDRYYLDQMKLWANFAMLKTWPGDALREGGKGILAQNQARGIAWALRNLVDATAFLPDTDSTRDYFRARVQNNLEWLENYGRTTDGGPLEFAFFGQPSGETFIQLSTWQNAYIAWAIDRANLLGFTPGQSARDRIVRLQIRLFTSEPEWPTMYGGPYYLKVGTVSGKTMTLYQTLRQVFVATYGSPPAPPQPLAGYYGPEARLMLQIGVRDGMPGAREALDFLMPFIAGDINKRSGWAVDDPPPPPVSESSARGKSGNR